MGLKFAVVCASNNNRSMEAHGLFLRKNLNVRSYGTGQYCKLPGKQQPNAFEFGTQYSVMLDKLLSEDEDFHRELGMINVLERNMKIKPAPQRWQAQESLDFDVVICFEERVYNSLLEDMQQRHGSSNSFSVFLIPTEDTVVEAVTGANRALQLAMMLEESDDFEDEVEEIIEKFNERFPSVELLHTTCFN
jgi:RNA polymerase II subunit A C-terminal domain phosphatase SSU72